MSDDLPARARALSDQLRRLYPHLPLVPPLIDELIAEVERCHKALHYIAGYDVAGYVPHLRSKDVARAALEKTNA